jgi:hypothetical protein
MSGIIKTELIVMEIEEITREDNPRRWVILRVFFCYSKKTFAKNLTQASKDRLIPWKAQPMNLGDNGVSWNIK